LLNLIAGVVLPTSGRITTNDVDVTALDDGRRRAFRVASIGLVFQEFELIEYLGVLDNILLPYRINPALRLNREVRRRAHDLAVEVGLDDKLSRNVRRLSQGERQRVAVCRALLPSPPLLLADEPTGNLDPGNRDHVLDILFDYVAKSRATLVTVTHDQDLLPRFDRVLDLESLRDGGAP
jgi:putative ABC transport system ATP-binding protein